MSLFTCGDHDYDCTIISKNKIELNVSYFLEGFDSIVNVALFI